MTLNIQMIIDYDLDVHCQGQLYYADMYYADMYYAENVTKSYP